MFGRLCSLVNSIRRGANNKSYFCALVVGTGRNNGWCPYWRSREERTCYVWVLGQREHAIELLFILPQFSKPCRGDGYRRKTHIDGAVSHARAREMLFWSWVQRSTSSEYVSDTFQILLSFAKNNKFQGVSKYPRNHLPNSEFYPTPPGNWPGEDQLSHHQTFNVGKMNVHWTGWNQEGKRHLQGRDVHLTISRGCIERGDISARQPQSSPWCSEVLTHNTQWQPPKLQMNMCGLEWWWRLLLWS